MMKHSYSKAKKLIAALLAAVILLALGGCGSTSPDAGSVSSGPASADPSSGTTAGAETDAFIYTNAIGGSEMISEDEMITEYPITYTGELTPEILAEALTELTGLDFFITATTSSDGIVVDWSAESTLVAGLDDREQKDEFFMFDAVSLSWFMMDSLYTTIQRNFDVESVYYTMNGGETLTLNPDMPMTEIPSDAPYMGSVFYHAHMDVRGEEDIEYPITDDMAFDILAEALGDKFVDGTGIQYDGMEFINDEPCWLMTFGKNDAAAFTPEEYYAVSCLTGEIFIADSTGDFQPLPLG